jgi:hypothetical protein
VWNISNGKRLEKKSKHVTGYYYIWKEGSWKKKVSGCQFFLCRDPLATNIPSFIIAVELDHNG